MFRKKIKKNQFIKIFGILMDNKRGVYCPHCYLYLHVHPIGEHISDGIYIPFEVIKETESEHINKWHFKCIECQRIYKVDPYLRIHVWPGYYTEGRLELLNFIRLFQEGHF